MGEDSPTEPPPVRRGGENVKRRVGNTKSANAYFGGRLNSSNAPAKAIAPPMTILDFGAFVEFTPSQIKQALTGWGNADKYE